MTDDLVKRVAQIIEAKRSFLSSGRLAREIIAECFRLRDMKDAPRDGTDILVYFPQDRGWLRAMFDQHYRQWMLSPDGARGDIDGDLDPWA